MNLWKLEWIRLTRTRRWIALVGVYLFFGLVGPLTAKYMGEIMAGVGDFEVVLPDPIAADGIAGYASNALQIGLLVSIGVAAAALAFDANPQMGVFLRTRVTNVREIITPRYVVITAAVMASFAAGSIAALYESTVLMGALPFGAWALGTALGCLYLAFAMAVVAAAAGKIRSPMAITIAAVLVLLVLPIVALIPDVGEWLPSHLVGALDSLVRGTPATDYIAAALVTAGATAGLLLLAVHWSSRKSA